MVLDEFEFELKLGMVTNVATIRLETKSCRILSLTYVTKYDLT